MSLPCYVFVILYLLFKKNQRQAIHNHAILVLLIMSFFIVLFDYSWIVDSNLRGEVWLASPAFCQIWLLIDFGFYSASTIVLAWASFERHILIFHSNLTRTTRGVILFHHFPLIFILIYSSIFISMQFVFHYVKMSMILQQPYVELLLVIYQILT